MADVRIGVAIDPTQAERGAARVGRAVDQVKDKVKKSQREFFSFNNTIKDFAKGLFSIQGLLGGLTIGAVFSGLGATISRFNASMADLSAITGATGRDLAFLRDAAKEFGATTRFSASQAAEGFKLIASAKPDLLDNVAALKQVTKETLILASAAGIDLPTAASSLGQALNQFGAGADQAARFVNVLAAGSKFGAAEIPQLSAALVNAGVAASSAGLSFEQTVTSLELLAKSGLVGEQAGSKLSSILTRLTTQGNREFNPAAVGMEQALKNMAKAGLDSADNVDKAQKIFGQFSINAARALIRLSGEFNDLETALTGTNTAYEQAAVKSDTLEGDLRTLASAAESLRITIAEGLEPTFRGMVQGLTDFILMINEGVPAVGEFVSELLDLVAAVAAGVAIAKLALFLGSMNIALTGLNMILPTVIIGVWALVDAVIKGTAAMTAWLAANPAVWLAAIAAAAVYTALKMDDLTDSIDENQKMLDEQKNSVSSLASSMNALSEQTDAELRDSRDRTQAALNEAIAIEARAAARFSEVSTFQRAMSSLGGAIGNLDQIFTGDFWAGRFGTAVGELRTDMQLAEDRMNHLLELRRKLDQEISRRPSMQPVDATGGGEPPETIDPDKIDDARQSLTDLQDKLRQQRDTFDQGAGAVMRYRLSLGDLSEQVKALPSEEAQKLSSNIISMADAIERLESKKALEETTRRLKEQIIAVGAGPVAVARYSAEHGRLAEQLKKSGEGAEEFKEEIIELNRVLAAARIEEQFMDPQERFRRRKAELRDLGLSQRAYNEALREAEEALFAEMQARNGLRREYMAYIELRKSDIGLQQAVLDADIAKGFDNQADGYRRQNAILEEHIGILRDVIAEYRKLPETVANNTAINQIEAMIARLRGQVRSLGDDIKETFKGAMEESLADVLRGRASIEDAFDSMVNNILDSLADMYSKIIIQQLQQILLPQTAGGSSGNILTSILGAGFPARQRGGPAVANRPYLVGEKQPEIFIPGTSGHVIPEANVGGVNVTMNIMTPDANSFRASQDQISRDQADMVRHAQRFAG